MGLKIAIDGAFMVTGQPGGYRSYTTNLVHTLARQELQHQYHLLVDRDMDWAPPDNWAVVTIPRSGSIGFIWREQVRLPRYTNSGSVDVLHVPGATGPVHISVPLVVTIHDTIEFTDPLPSIRQTKRWAMRQYSRMIQAKVVKTAAHVLTVSQYSKQQIISRFGISANKITVTSPAPGPAFSSFVASSSTLRQVDRATISSSVLAIASAARRKNTEGVIRAYAGLPSSIRRLHTLVLVCTHADVYCAMQALASRLSLAQDICLLKGVTDSELANLYQSACVFVFPSFEEGFGLPPLEAMTCGTPVIASNTSSLPEVCGDAAILVNPADIPAISDAMLLVLSDPAHADQMRHRGLMQCRKFSWQETARRTAGVYASVCQSR